MNDSLPVLFDVLGYSPLAGTVHVFLLVVRLVGALEQTGLELALVELHASHEQLHVLLGLGYASVVVIEGVELQALDFLLLLVLEEVLLDLGVGQLQPERFGRSVLFGHAYYN